jgi:hypothetical protein
MYLKDIFRNIGVHGRYHSPLIRSCGNHHIGGFNGATVCGEQIAAEIGCLLQRRDFHSTARRGLNERRVVLDESNDLTTRREGVWIIALIFVAGQFDGPVGELKAEGNPAFTAPTFTHSAAFEDHMLPPSLTEIVTHGEAGVTAADDNRINLLGHRSSLLLVGLPSCYETE